MISKKPFKTDAIVRVVTHSGRTGATYSSLEEARVHYPELNPDEGSKIFTSAMHDSEDGSIMRFESWKAYEDFSA